MKPLFSITALFLVINLSNAQEVQPTNPDLRKIREEIISLIEQKQIPSMAIGVSKGDTIFWQEALGYADIESKKAARTNSLYPLGSISKSITASLVMNLINNNKLKLTDNIQGLIKPIQLMDIDDKQPTIPIWQVLNMTAGLNHGYSAFEWQQLPKTKNDKAKFLQGQAVLAFKPGMVYEYTNHSYSMLEFMLENISGKDISDYAPEILRQIRVKNTLPLFNSKHENIVSTYNEKLEKISPSFAFPGGGQGYYSTVEDLLHYGMFHLGVKPNPSFISEQNLNLMHTFRQGPGDLFGLGWFNNSQVLVSNGNVTGGNARITLDKKQGLVIICLLNRTSWDGLADQFASKIHEVFVTKDCDKGYETWKRIYETPYTPRLELIGKWSGILKDPRTTKSLPVTIHFSDDGQISFGMNGQTTQLRNPAYNLFNELTGSLKAKIPTDSSEASLDVKLKYDNLELRGYFSASSSDEGFGVKQPYQVLLKRK